MMLNNIRAKLSNKHFLSLAGNGAMAMFSVLTYIILFRVLSPEDMGNWVFFQFAIIFIETFRTGFLQSALIIFYSGTSQKMANNVVGSSWYIGIVITGVFIALNVVGVLIFGYIGTEDPSVILLLKWLGVSLLTTLPFNLGSWIQQAKDRFDHILYIRLINQGSFILFIIIFYVWGNIDLNTIVYSFIASSALTSILTLIFGWSSFRNLKDRSKECIQKIFDYGKYSVGTVLSSNLLKTSDSFIIKIMLGPAALAIFNVSQRLLDILEVPLRSFVATAMPELSAAHNQGDKSKVSTIMQKYAGMLTMLLIPLSIGSLIFADFIVLIIGGEQYAGTASANIFRIFMVFGVFFPIDRFLGITLDMVNQPKLNLIKVIIMLTVNVVGDYIGIVLFDNLYAVAVVSVFTFLAGVIFGYKALRRYLVFTLRDIITTGFRESVSLVKNLLNKNKLHTNS
ncbi:lipopolysaccharide biosynthesis protein [Anditalea andensis]|uniref:Polysaccharide biosynthesis protein n=1 Tax=Anditalea andensis TaxID=1048983 RepID=A0A074KYW0_9BACT|nr:oligosaccharide flippase family protein [Anditalea andensis]KEO75146.1 hypothetical protein EL17_05615 [Anditalea andensis]